MIRTLAYINLSLPSNLDLGVYLLVLFLDLNIFLPVLRISSPPKNNISIIYISQFDLDSTDLYDHKIRESEGSSTCILQKHGVYFDIFSRFFYIMRNVVNKNKRKYVIIKCRHLVSYKNKAKHFSHSLVLLDILLISCGFSVSR